MSRRGTGEVNSRILAYLDEPRRLSEVAKEFDLTYSNTGTLLTRLLDYDMVKRVRRGVYVRNDDLGKPDCMGTEAGVC